ncbi:DUF600 family protein [Peribacillus asahii]|uniref:DUF600 family protein n=1 Tax=Peribacillus asahii TaxID=228899 RepID=A0A398BG38_9BACI|nr:immunity protein YezG family protein [Peribacillus asahii]RID89379.1 DUF600 family protein [Peribacillus asahii]
MDELKLNSLYQKIAQTVNEMILEEWSKVLVYGEINKHIRTSFFYYYGRFFDGALYL